LPQFSGAWWVAHTRSRNEKALAWHLQTKNVQYFLPMTWKVSKTHGRTIRSLLPLFTGYMFFCGNENDRIEALKSNRVANLIPVIDSVKLIRELTPIDILIRQGTILLPHKYLKEGQRVRVIAGPLMGTEGIILREPEKLRLVLQVDILGQAASVEIDADFVEPVDPK
jgi:transcription termination/antitermination protein NusG